MSLKLRPYQERAIEELNKKFKTTNKVVLSLCPSGGKTVTALYYALEHSKNALILAHGTSILRTQWKNRIEEFKLDDSTLEVNLPQSLYSKPKLKKVDLLVIDEAHEFYFAKSKSKGMVESIIEKCKPNKILLLTGTPSKFIKNKYETVIVSADELIEQDFINNVYFGLASTTEKLKASDFTADDNVKSNKVFKETKNTLDELMVQIERRLKGTFFKTSPNVKMNMPNMFSALHKTMVTCNNIKQADEVHSYFVKNGVKAVVSHNDNDYTSSNIQEFIDKPSIKVLVVVNRGILGFDMPELVNVVDLTCTRNIDRIYQLYARVMRKHPNFKMKYFFKVVPEVESDLYKFYLTASLCLLGKDFISNYNGKNLDASSIPVIMPKKSKVGKKAVKVKSKPTKEKIVPIDEFFYGTVTATELLNDLINKKGRKYNEYAFTTIGNIKEKNYGKTRQITQVTEEVVKWLVQADANDKMPKHLEESLYA